MAKVAAFQLPGLVLWFNSNDHLPPHFHAEQPDDWEVRVRFHREPDEMIEIVWADRAPKEKTLAKLRRLAEANREQLFQEWEEKVAPPGPGPAR